MLIITHAFNRPDFIEIQYKTFKKFFEDDYEFVVFSNAKDDTINKQIEQTCKKYNIPYIRIPQDIHTKPYLKRGPADDFQAPSVRCSNSLQYSLDILGFTHDDLVMIIDSDMFLIKNFSLRSYMDGYDLAGMPQGKKPVTYLSNQLVFLNMATLPEKETINFNCGQVEGQMTDSGGYTHHYLTKFDGQHEHSAINVKYIPHVPSGQVLCAQCREKAYWKCRHNTEHLKASNFTDCEIAFIQKGPAYVEFMLDHTFLHYRAGGNWMNESPEFHQIKTQILLDFIEEIL